MKVNFAAVCAAFAALISTPQTGLPQNANSPSRLKVAVHYSGTGTIDQEHKIYVVLWDSPDFVKSREVMPSAIQSTSSKRGVVTFDNVNKTPVYVSAVYDPAGKWDAQSPPPEGSSLGLYSKIPGTPEPIDLKPGKTILVELPFDDSVKMKGGQPAR